jgi:hypothetical protein
MNTINNLALILILFFIMFCVVSCEKGGPAGEYIKHLNHVLSLIKKNNSDAMAAGEAVYRYVDDNKASIGTVIEALRALNPRETAGVADPIIMKVNEIIQYIKDTATEEYSLGNSQKLIDALLILHVI